MSRLRALGLAVAALAAPAVELAAPNGMAFTPDGSLFVADTSNQRVIAFDAGGAFVRAFSTAARMGSSIGGDRVFVSHYAGDEIVVFGPAPERTELYRFAAPPTAALPLARPTGIALTHDCYLLVASFTNGGIFVFRHQGDTACSQRRDGVAPGAREGVARRS